MPRSFNFLNPRGLRVFRALFRLQTKGFSDIGLLEDP